MNSSQMEWDFKKGPLLRNLEKIVLIVKSNLDCFGNYKLLTAAFCSGESVFLVFLRDPQQISFIVGPGFFGSKLLFWWFYIDGAGIWWPAGWRGMGATVWLGWLPIRAGAECGSWVFRWCWRRCDFAGGGGCWALGYHSREFRQFPDIF